MFDSNKDTSQNLKDSRENSTKDTFSTPVPYKKNDNLSESYPRLKKLITALYIVTDIMDKEEPIRLKLRTFGVEILSDINYLSRTDLNKKIQVIMSFLDISLTINLISEMNFNILKKEFARLSESLEEVQKSGEINHTWLEEFLKPSESLPETIKSPKPLKNRQDINNFAILNKADNTSPNLIKQQRREDIIESIRLNGGSATITEVKKGSPVLAFCGEKTLQRELISMVRDQILDKTGEKRWSKYYLKSESLLPEVGL